MHLVTNAEAVVCSACSCGISFCHRLANSAYIKQNSGARVVQVTNIPILTHHAR